MDEEKIKSDDWESWFVQAIVQPSLSGRVGLHLRHTLRIPVTMD